jgi:hypothetical protein
MIDIGDVRGQRARKPEIYFSKFILFNYFLRNGGTDEISRRRRMSTVEYLASGWASEPESALT